MIKKILQILLMIMYYLCLCRAKIILLKFYNRLIFSIFDLQFEIFFLSS